MNDDILEVIDEIDLEISKLRMKNNNLERFLDLHAKDISAKQQSLLEQQSGLQVTLISVLTDRRDNLDGAGFNSKDSILTDLL